MTEPELTEATLREALQKVGTPAVLIVPPGPLEAVARELCEDGAKPAVFAGVTVDVQADAHGWRCIPLAL